MDLASVRAVVTGGASGLGRATAARLAGAGARVAILDRPASPGADVAPPSSRPPTSPAPPRSPAPSTPRAAGSAPSTCS